SRTPSAVILETGIRRPPFGSSTPPLTSILSRVRSPTPEDTKRSIECWGRTKNEVWWGMETTSQIFFWPGVGMDDVPCRSCGPEDPEDPFLRIDRVGPGGIPDGVDRYGLDWGEMGVAKLRGCCGVVGVGGSAGGANARRGWVAGVGVGGASENSWGG